MLSNKKIVCPENLLKVEKNKKDVTAGIVNAGKPLPMHSAMEAVKQNLITPIFIGDANEIKKNRKFSFSPKNPARGFRGGGSVAR